MYVYIHTHPWASQTGLNEQGFLISQHHMGEEKKLVLLLHAAFQCIINITDITNQHYQIIE